jgi:hypothetical protein
LARQVHFRDGMSVAASQAPSTGIAAALEATSSTPAPKTSGAASATANTAAAFPGLFGQMLEAETQQQAASFLRGDAAESKATTAPVAGASKKTAGEKSRSATGTAAPDSGQNPAASDAVPVLTANPWLPQSGQLAFTLASRGAFSETGGDSNDGAADPAATTAAGAGTDVASVPVAACQPSSAPNVAANLVQTFFAAAASTSSGSQTTAPGDGTGEIAAAAAEQPADSADLRPIVSAALGGAGAAAGRPGHRAPAEAVSSSQSSAYATPVTVAPPDERTPESGRTAAASAMNRAKTPAPRPGGTETASSERAAVTRQASGVAGEAVDTAASLFARLAARNQGQTSEQDGATPDQAATAASTDVEPTGGDRAAGAGALAFQALLVPLPASAPQLTGQIPQATGAAAAAIPAAGSSAGLGGGRSGSSASRDPDPGPAAALLTVRAGAAVQSPNAAPPVSSNAAAAPTQSAKSGQSASPASAGSSAASAAELAAAPKPAASGAAREIRLELRDADARVDVRLVERAGTIQVDVRTADGHLASSLRDDLPALTARLEQSGLRAETWHDAPAAAAGRSRIAEASSSAGFESSQNQSRREGGGRDPRDGEPQEKRQHHPESESKEFSWLYTSLT